VDTVSIHPDRLYTRPMPAAAKPSPATLLPHPILSELMQISTEDLDVRPMMGRIAAALAQHFGWEFVALVSVDHKARQFVCEAVHTDLPTDIHVGYTRELGTGVVGEVAMTAKPVLVSDASIHPGFVHTLKGGQSELCVPVLHRGEVLAVLNLESRSRNAFEGQVALLEVIAGHIAGAIAAARRVEELRRQSTLLNLVANFSRTALETENLDALLNHLLEFLGKRFKALEATVLLESDLRDHLEVMAHRGASPHISYRGKQWPISEGLVGLCYRSGDVVFVPDVRLRRDYAVVNSDVVAEMAVPIRMRGRVFGVLNLEAADAAVFAEHERLIFTTIADQVAGAIHLFAMNRRLQQSQLQAERRGEELTTTREHLRRAVVKLDRRALREQHAGVLTEVAFARQVTADLRAVARGGRALMLAAVNVAEAVSDDAWRMLITHFALQLPDARMCRDSARLWIGMLLPPESDESPSAARLSDILKSAPGPAPLADLMWLRPGQTGKVAELMQQVPLRRGDSGAVHVANVRAREYLPATAGTSRRRNGK
jgi:GAF domain-containing protein